MTDKDLFEKRKEILREVIGHAEYSPLKFKELAYLMGVPQAERGELKKVLEDLILAGDIECTSRGKYIKAENKNLVGTFVGHAKGYGFVEVEGQKEDIFIPAVYVNGAFHHDTVKVKVFPSRKGGDHRKEGVILKILKRGTPSLVGTFSASKEFGFVIPDDRHFGKDIFISKRNSNHAGNHQKVVVKILDYGSEKKNPEGAVIQILGNADDPATEVTSIIMSHGIEEDFPSAALKQAARLPKDVTCSPGDGRADYRDLLTVTIDGEDARDLDDAITLRKYDRGYSLGVHIADVTHYVREGSPLDVEAAARGTSVYLPDRVIPMLPRALSNGICSLNAGEDRFALSCIIEFDFQGNVTDHRITESVIHVDQRMSYEGVYAILSGEKHPEGEKQEIKELCFLMQEAAAILKARRKVRGAIDFDFPESEILLDAAGRVSEICPYERNTATDIIEDFMLLANETVAEDYFWQELPFLFRVHESPEPEKLKKLQIFIRNFGYYMKTGRASFHPKEVQKLLFSLEGAPEEPLISRLVLRTMQRAKYSTLNSGHFGLSTQYYTHFTSPIRRYPDLQIHRIIKEGLHGGLNSKRIAHYEGILPEVAAHSSRMERRAQDVEREVEKLKKAEYMEQRIGQSFIGVISGVTAWGFFVELPNTVEGLVSLHSLEDDLYCFDEEEYKITGQYTGRTFTLGQQVEIVVENADRSRKTVDFILREFSDPQTPDQEADELVKLYTNMHLKNS